MILIVDDEPLARDSMREILEDEGYRVIVAGSGQEAMQQLEHVQPALMILDLLMPGMHGNALYDEMQKSPQLSRIPVLVTTGDPSRAPRGVPTLDKPLRLHELLSLVALACGRG